MTKCMGCGSILQNTDPSAEGYVRDLSKDLCERCFKIRHYNEYRFIDKDNNYYVWSDSFMGLLSDIRQPESSNPWA